MTALVEAPAAVIENYYSDTTHVSRSMLEDFIKSPALYYGRYIAKTIPMRQETDAMKLGTAVHAMLFETESVAAAPKCDRRTKEGKATWAAFCADDAESLIIDADDYKSACAMVHSVINHPIANEILDGIYASEKVVTRQHRTGIDLKSKIDLLTRWNSQPFIGDLKTTGDPYPSSWPRALPNYGYHRQAAFYSDMAPIKMGWLWIVVGSEAPFETFVYEATEATIDIGRAENESALQRLADCMKSGRWIHPQSEQVNNATLPRWYLEKEGSNHACDW